MRLSHLRFALAVLAARLSSARSSLPDPRAMVLELTDLPPGDWRRKGVRSFRTGLMAPTAPWAKRLQEARGTSFVVAYNAVDDPWAVIGSQAIPFPSTADAAAAFPMMEERFLANPDLYVVETRRADVELGTPPGDQHTALALESTNLREPGSQGAQLLVLWQHGAVLAFLTIGGRAGRFSLDDLGTLALRQDKRIAQALQTQ